MANPSLQIGNSNWAIKEDNLLGYSTAGTRFVPQPITMTRASAGTRVNSSGLVETVELLGSEDVTNGDFTQLPLGTGWDAYTSGSSTVAFTEGAILSIDGSNSNVGVYQQNIFTNGVQYKIIVSVKATASFDAEIVESQGAATQTTIGTVSLTTSYQDFVFYFTGTGTNDLFIHRLYGETAGQNQQIYIKEVSVKESTKNNLARVDYDGTASSLLVEPERTNLITESSDFTTWTTTGSAEVTPNTTISPDGTQNADTLNIFSGNFFYKPITSGAGTFTLSCYVKVASGTLDFKMQSFNGTDGADASSTFTANTNWQRFEFTTTVTTDSNFYPIQVSGLTGGDFQIWGAQLEVGSYATSYIPTDGGTVTRVQDQYSKAGISNLINSEEGVLFIEMAALSDDETKREITLSDGTHLNYVLIRFNSGGSNIIYTRVDVDAGGGLQYWDLDNSHTITNTNKIAIRWGASNFATFINGVKVGSQLSGSSFSADTLNELNFDNGTGGSNFFGKVKQLQVFKTALTDTELETLTTI